MNREVYAETLAACLTGKIPVCVCHNCGLPLIKTKVYRPGYLETCEWDGSQYVLKKREYGDEIIVDCYDEVRDPNHEFIYYCYVCETWNDHILR